jgi:NADH-quinone oxidoreductase subunit C
MSEEKEAKKPAAPKSPQAAQAGRARPVPPRARAAAKPKEEKPLPPSPKQPVVDGYAKLISEKISPEAVESAFINQTNDHLPTLSIKKEFWVQVAELFKNHSDLAFDYMQNYSGVDYETYLEIVVHLYSMSRGERVCFKVKSDREVAKLPTITHLWEAANWNEREIYDLLGIEFTGHPDMRRMFLPEDWVGHPLRKDYVPLDEEV